MGLCPRCKHQIKGQFKEYQGGRYHTYCHRSVISDAYDFIRDAISAWWLFYRGVSGEIRVLARRRLRELFAQYHALSY